MANNRDLIGDTVIFYGCIHKTEYADVTASTIGRDTVSIKSAHDVSIKGSNLLGTHDITLFAGNAVRIDSAEEIQRSDVYQHSTMTNYVSHQPADLSAQHVIVDGKHNTAHVVQSHEEKCSSLTVSVWGPNC